MLSLSTNPVAKLFLDTFRLGCEAHNLMGLRLFAMATGGVPPLPECLSVNKLNDLSDLCFGARREIGAADVDQREPRSLRPEQASLPK